MSPTETTLDISTLSQLHKNLFWEIESHQSVEVDLKNVNEIDFSTIQLFIAAALYAFAQKKEMTYVNLQAQPTKAIKLLGADTLLGVVHG